MQIALVSLKRKSHPRVLHTALAIFPIPGRRTGYVCFDIVTGTMLMFLKRLVTQKQHQSRNICLVLAFAYA